MTIRPNGIQRVGFPLPFRSRYPIPLNPNERNNGPSFNVSAPYNPGEYQNRTFRSTGLGIGPYPNGTPSCMVVWAELNDYNCLEIDCECIVCPRGWAVPDKIAVFLYPNRLNNPFPVPTFTSESVISGGWYDGTPDFSINPPKTYVTPIAGDPTLSSTIFNGRVCRAYGLQPFQRVGIVAYALNDPVGSAIQINPAQQPFFRVRRWYDGSIKSLRMES